MIQIYTGEGKGKTTAALGLILRALGAGKKTCLIQFMKKDENYGEIKFLKSHREVDLFQFGSGNFVDPRDPAEIDRIEAGKAFKKAKEILIKGKHDILILDEINTAVAWGLLKIENQLDLMDLAGETEVIMTGRNAEPEVIKRADLVTEMLKIKHYYDKGLKAREGIEF